MRRGGEDFDYKWLGRTSPIFLASHAEKCALDPQEKAEHQRIDAFELSCWRRLLRVLWTARRSSQSTLKEINPEYSLEGLDAEAEVLILDHLM